MKKNATGPKRAKRPCVMRSPCWRWRVRRGIEEGLEKGLEKGLEEATRKTARNLIQLGALSDAQIAQATGLTLAKVEALRRTT